MNGIDTRSLASGANPIAEGFEAQNQKIQAAQRQKDNDMLRVLEFAGDGRVPEAQAYARSRGVESMIPPEIYKNGDLAKGAALGAKNFPDDSVAAQKFTMAWMKTSGDDAQRMTQARGAVGPFDPNDRDYKRLIDMMSFKKSIDPKNQITPYQSAYLDLQRKKLNQPPISKYEAGLKAKMAVIELGGTPEEAAQAEKAEHDSWDKFYASGAPQLSSGMTGTLQPSTDDPVMESRNAIAAQQAKTGVSPQQRPDLVTQGIPAQNELKVGTVYNTKMGPMQWDGAGFIPSSGTKIQPMNQSSPQQVNFQPADISFSEDRGGGVGVDRYGFRVSSPGSTRGEVIANTALNAINVPASLNAAGDYISRGLVGAGEAIGSGIQYGGEAISNAAEYINQSSDIMVVSPEGRTGWIPRSNLDVALSKGYTLPHQAPQAPISR